MRLAVALAVTRGSPWPGGWATVPQLGWLALSGLVSSVFGDTYDFRALLILGPGHGALPASPAPRANSCSRRRALRNRRGRWVRADVAFFGPFLGVTLALVALQHIDAGVAASITALPPVIAILTWSRFHPERLTVRTLIGVSSVVVLFMS